MVGTIVVGTDGSPTASRAVDFAIELAAGLHAELVIGSCYEPVPEDQVLREQRDAPEEIKWSISPTEEVDATLREAIARAREKGIAAASEARMGNPAQILCEIAEDAGADLLVVGSQGMDRRLRGSVPNTVSHSAPCSVLVVKTD